MTDTFFLFNKLPGELRAKIWHFAIRSTDRGVNLFYMYDLNADRDVGSTRDVPDFRMPHFPSRLADPIRSEDCSTSMSFALQSSSMTTPIVTDGWTDRMESASKIRANISTYTVDGGLWTACKESRYYIRGVFPPEKRSTWKARERRRNADDEFLTTYFAAEDQLIDHSRESMHRNTKTCDIRYLTIRPCLDLFFLRPHSFKTFSWESIILRHGWRPSKLDGVKHIALEYSPEWGFEIGSNPRHPTFHAFLEVLEHLGHFDRTLWFIDYGIRRSRKESATSSKQAPSPEAPSLEAPSMASERRTFYATNRRYVEVACCSHPHDGQEWEIEYESKDGLRTSSLSFIETLRVGMDKKSISVAPDEHYFSCDIGVLACEFL
jgi:hypothetical protein